MQQPEVHYCVTAIIDLLGFSSHLEVGANDIRTNIGQAALERLQTLVDALALMQKEKAAYPIAYPSQFSCMRVNDALMLTMDLPDFLKPQVGSHMKAGWSVKDLEKHFNIDDYETEEEFATAYEQKLFGSLADLIRFVGLVARLHEFINNQESASFFPGAKTILASGYRRPFSPGGIEDVWAANFSFSNAYLADAQLHGPRLFLDCNIAQLLCGQKFAKNIVRQACYIHQSAAFDPLVECENVFSSPSESVKSQPKEVSIFRKPFFFQQFNSRPLTYLQTIEPLMQHLKGELEPKSSDFALKIFNAIKNGPATDKSACGAFLGCLNIQESIEEVVFLITTGLSSLREQTVNSVFDPTKISATTED